MKTLNVFRLTSLGASGWRAQQEQAPLMQRLFFAFFCFVLVAGPVSAKPMDPGPDCAGAERWPASMAFVKLKNAALLNSGDLDSSRTQSVRVSSEQIGRDLYRQVHHVTFVTKTGVSVEALTVSNASSQECSMSEVEVFVVKAKL